MAHDHGPFDVNLHVMSGDIPEKHYNKIHQLKRLLSTGCAEYKEQYHLQKFCTNMVCHHFLIARKYSVEKSYKLLVTALEWRHKRNPNQWFRSDTPKEEMAAHEKEARTGKIQLCGRDRFDREVIVFDNSVQNTSDADGQLNFLAWNLELAIHTMPDHVDKYVVFMHLGNFSIFNSPPLQTTKETILMLTSCYPERLGHCICYQPPYYFFTVFNMLKTLGLIDKRTLQKVKFIQGDVSEGSENDKLLSSIIGSNWKALTNATSKVMSPGCSPGFVHEEYWPWLLQRWEQVNFRLFANSSFDSSKLDLLSTKVTADDGDDVDSLDEDTEVDEGTTAKLVVQSNKESAVVRWMNQKLRRGLRLAISLLNDGVRGLKALMERVDDIGNTPIYGTITTHVAVAFVTVICIIGFVIKVFYSTFAGTVNFIFVIMEVFKCAIDTTGTCQSDFIFTTMPFLALGAVKLSPFVAISMGFVVLLHKFHEQSHGVGTFIEGLEMYMERSSREAKRDLKRIKKETREEDLGKEIFDHLSLFKLALGADSDESAESDGDDASSDDGDEDNMIVHQGRLLRGKVGQKVRRREAYHKALRVISRQQDPGSLSSVSTPATPAKTSNTPKVEMKVANMDSDSPFKTPTKLRTSASMNEIVLENTRSPTSSMKKRMARPSYSNLPEDERPMALDSDMESI